MKHTLSLIVPHPDIAAVAEVHALWSALMYSLYSYRLLQGLQQLEANANTHLSEYFQEETVDEWLSILVTEKRQKISDIVNNALEQINLGARVKGTKIDVEN